MQADTHSPLLSLERRRRLRWYAVAYLVVVIAVLGGFKVYRTAHNTSPNIDGGYYTNIAQHVRDGNGLKTNISLYHQGYSYFPHPTTVSPLWPLVYGMSARVVPLLTAGMWLPTIFYLFSLVFAYLWGASLVPEELFPRQLPGFNAGHVLVLMLGTHGEYFVFTSLPYTEGLTYLLVFIGLWRFNTHWRRPSLVAGLEMGFWLGLMFLARSQLIIVSMALLIALVFAVAVARRKKPFALMTMGTIVALTIVGGWYVYLVSGVVEGGVSFSILRFDQARENDLLSEFKPIVQTSGLWHYIKDRAQGFIVAFKLEGKTAYTRCFYLYQYALVVALPFFVLAAVSNLRGFNRRHSWHRVCSARGFMWMSYILLALAGFFTIHMIHKNYFVAWNFARRQALTTIFIFFFSLIFLLRQRRFPALILGIFILTTSAYFGYRHVERTAKRVPTASTARAQSYLPDLVRWLNQTRRKNGYFTVAMAAQTPQKVAYLTPGVNYHWIYNKTTFVDLKRLVSDLGVEYIFLYNAATRWPLRRHPQFNTHFIEQKQTYNGYKMYIPSEKMFDRKGPRAP